MATMTTRVGDVYTTSADALVMAVRAGGGLPEGLDERFAGQLTPTLAAAQFSGKRDEIAAYTTFGQLPARWLVLAGIGGVEETTEEHVRRAYGAALKRARDEGARSVAVCLPERATAGEVRAALEGALLALYRYTRYKSEAALAREKVVESIEVWGADDALLAEALAVAHATAGGVMLARDLVNTISDDKVPALVAELAEEVARENELECTVLDREALAAGGYHSILTVGKGSIHEPRLVEMIYTPAGTPTRTVALVGKTITFDSGGLDLKSQDGMSTMKNDLGGGAAVLGVMKALAVLQPNVRVIGILTAAENMPSGSSMRPSDVVRALNGKTFEVGNTDAEGRMVLADAVTHAARAGADEIFSIATLTGHPFYHWGAAALGNDDALRDRFLAVAQAAGEKVWPLPIWDEAREELNSPIADFRSVGAGWSGDTIRAAAFIREFTEGVPWLHLDIAFNASTDAERPYTPIGGTGVMVRSLLRYLEGL